MPIAHPSLDHGSEASPARPAATRHGRAFVVLASLVLAAGGCGGDAAGTTTTLPGPSPTAPAPAVTVVATTSIVGDIVRNVAGDAATVAVLMPAGADPHDFVASSRQVATMQEADLVVAVGLDLEEGLISVLAAVESAGTPVLRLAPLLDPIPFGDPDEDHGDDDPHFWMDPQRVANAARLIAAALGAIEPGVDWAAAAEAHAFEMERIDEVVRSIFTVIADGRRLLVTNHDALGYFADRYGFTVIGTVIPGGTTMGAPSAAELVRLVDVIEDHQIPAIFAETIDATSLADALAAEVGHPVKVVVLSTDSLGEPGTEAGTLAGMLVSNARLIAEALSP